MKVFFLVLSFLVLSFNSFALNLKSLAFVNDGYIPDRYTCDSLNISPELEFSNVPEKTKSLVLICEDPDASTGGWVHWIVFNISPMTTNFDEDIKKDAVLPDGALQGVNDFGETGYGGACPPAGKPHRYIFKLYALDTMLQLEKTARKKDVKTAMIGHIIQETKLSGLYQRKITN